MIPCAQLANKEIFLNARTKWRQSCGLVCTISFEELVVIPAARLSFYDEASTTTTSYNTLLHAQQRYRFSLSTWCAEVFNRYQHFLNERYTQYETHDTNRDTYICTQSKTNSTIRDKHTTTAHRHGKYQLTLTRNVLSVVWVSFIFSTISLSVRELSDDITEKKRS